MKNNKSHQSEFKSFEPESQVFKVLANSKRLQIIFLLQNQKLSVGEMTRILGLPQANISQHLMILRKVNLLSTQKNGRRVDYHLTHPKLLEFISLLTQLLIPDNSHK